MRIGDKTIIKDEEGITYVVEVINVFGNQKSADTGQKTSIDKTLPIGSQLRDFRETCKLRQKQVAKEAGITVAALSRIETGETKTPHSNNIDSIIEAIYKLKKAD